MSHAQIANNPYKVNYNWNKPEGAGFVGLYGLAKGRPLVVNLVYVSAGALRKLVRRRS